MAEETENRIFGPQPYQFGQDVSQITTTPTVKDESPEVESTSYDKVTLQDAPDNPKSVREVIERGVVNVANPQHRGSTASTESGRPAISTDADTSSDATADGNSNSDTAGLERKIRTLQDMIDRLEPLETPEQRKKREQREKSAKIISAVSDGISALGNLYFTSQYAPNMYNHEKGSQLNAQNAAIERARKEREANRDAHLRFALALGDAENERAKTAREVEAEQERRKLARKKAEREAEQHDWLAALQPDKQREQKGKADTAEQKARTAQAEADNAPAMQEATLAIKKAQKDSYEASAANSYASAAAHGRSNVAEFIAYDKKGKAHPFRTAAAAEAFARQHGTWHETDETETTTTTTKRNPQAQPQTRTSSKTKKGGYAGKPSPTGGGKKSPTA